jgi:hypothetical protein
MSHPLSQQTESSVKDEHGPILAVENAVAVRRFKAYLGDLFFTAEGVYFIHQATTSADALDTIASSLAPPAGGLLLGLGGALLGAKAADMHRAKAQMALDEAAATRRRDYGLPLDQRVGRHAGHSRRVPISEISSVALRDQRAELVCNCQTGEEIVFECVTRSPALERVVSQYPARFALQKDEDASSRLGLDSALPPPQALLDLLLSRDDRAKSVLDCAEDNRPYISSMISNSYTMGQDSAAVYRALRDLGSPRLLSVCASVLREDHKPLVGKAIGWSLLGLLIAGGGVSMLLLTLLFAGETDGESRGSMLLMALAFAALGVGILSKAYPHICQLARIAKLHGLLVR